MRHLAYFIMPVGSDKEFQSKRAVLEASARARGWTAHFPMDPRLDPDSGFAKEQNSTLHEIVAGMRGASLIIADLTLERPSCYYELGIAQTVARPIYLMATAGTVIHQVQDREQVHFYIGLEELAALVDAAIFDTQQEVDGNRLFDDSAGHRDQDSIAAPGKRPT